MRVPREIIEGLVREHGSVNAAARAIGMPQDTLHKLYNGAPYPRLETLELLARAKNMPLWKLVREIERVQANGDDGSRD